MRRFVLVPMLLLSALAVLASTSTDALNSSPDQRRQQALQLEQQGNLAAAADLWLSLSRANPRNPEPFAHLGLLAARAEHYTEAEANYRKALALNPITPGLRLNLGLAYFKDGDLKQALEAFQTVLKTRNAAPVDLKRALVLVGMSYYGLGRYSEAVAPLQRAAAADSANLPLRLALAHSCLWSKQTECVLATYKEILAIDPNSAEADMIAGEALDEKGDNAGALQQFQAAEMANPKEPNVHFGLAYLLWAQKRYEEAVVEFKVELENDHGNTQSMIYLADAYVQMNRFEDARDILQRVEAVKPAEPLIHLDLGIVHQETGEWEKAVQELTLAVKLDPESVNAHFRLAKVYQQTGKRDEAKVEYAKASSLNKKADDSLFKRIADAKAGAGPETPVEQKPQQ